MPARHSPKSASWDGSRLLELSLVSLRYARLLGVPVWLRRPARPQARAVAALVAAAAALAITALNEHAPYDIKAGLAAQVVAGFVPLIAGALAGVSVMRPKAGLLATLLLIPVLDVGQLSWTVGPVQVIDQTICVVSLGLGLILRDPLPRDASGSAVDAAPLPDAPDAPGAAGRRHVSGMLARALARFSLTTVALGALVAMILLATLSTAISPNVALSATVLLHGILEPISIAATLLLLRPNRRYLVLAMVAIGISVALGGLVNMVQTIPTMKSLSQLQADRLLFSRITYFNVGLFGEVLAMTMPLVIGLLLALRNGYIRLPRVVVALLVVAVPLDLASLFLTFSKSGYLATFGGCLVLLLFYVQSWRRRVSIAAAVVLLSAVVVPWPALFLQVAPPLNQAYRSALVPIVGQSRFDSWNPATPSGEGSLMERFYATRAGIEMALDHPLLGISLDQFAAEYADHYRPTAAKSSLDWAHSMLPEVAAELGFPALALDVLIYAAGMLAAWRVYRSPLDPLSRLLACALLAAMVSWQVVGLAFAGDMYRPWRNMASDYVTMMVLVAAALALYQINLRGHDRGAAQAEPAAQG